MAKLAAGVKAVLAASAPGTNLHSFSYRLIAINTSEYDGKNSAIPLDKDLSSDLSPVGFLFFGFQD
jgi:hypothetical protein